MKIIFTIVCILIVSWIIWRYASSRHNIPCPTWLAWMIERDNPFTKVTRSESIIKHLEIDSSMEILDVGCGPGRLTIPLAEKLTNGRIVGMDMQQGMLDKVKVKATAKKLNNIVYVNAKLEDHDKELEENKYDRVLLVSVLGEIPDKESALKAIYRTLKPGGILSVTEIIFDPHFQSQKTILKLISELGFQQKSIFGNYFAYTMHLQKPINIHMTM